jgi:hypothetical protein
LILAAKQGRGDQPAQIGAGVDHRPQLGEIGGDCIKLALFPGQVEQRRRVALRQPA